MDELQAFIDEQKALDPEFAESFNEGYEAFRRGVLLRQACESRVNTRKDCRLKEDQKLTRRM